MTYAIIALVVLLVVVLYLLLARKPKEAEAPEPSRIEQPKRPAAEPAAPRREAAPKAAPEPQAQAHPTMPSAPPVAAPQTIAPETAVSEAPAAPVRDVAGLRKGLAKARGSERIFGPSRFALRRQEGD